MTREPLIKLTFEGEFRAPAPAWAGPVDSSPQLHLGCTSLLLQLSSCPKEKGSSLLLSWQKKKWVQVGNQRGAVTCLTSPSKSVTVPYLPVLEPVLFSDLGVCQRCAKVFVRGGGGGAGGVHTFGHEDVGPVGCRCHASYNPSLTYHGWSPGLP